MLTMLSLIQNDMICMDIFPKPYSIFQYWLLIYSGWYLCLSINMEKAMAAHSSTLAWKIPWTEEPRRLQSMRSLRVGHDWATSLCLFTFMHWRRKWQPTPMFLPGESHGQRSLVGYSPWGHKESDTTEQLHFHFLITQDILCKEILTSFT